MEGKTRNASDHQKNVRQILEGNERVWFHPFDDLLAVWYGGPQIAIVSSWTWEQQDVINIKSANRTLEEMETAATVKLASRGFDRCGRTEDNTTLTEA